MKYSISVPKAAKESGEVALAQRYDLNISYRDLGAVCDAIRYMTAESALELLDKVIKMKTAVEYRRHNGHMGSRHELGGRKGRYPIKCAREVRLTILNAMANAGNMGNLDAEKMVIIHASGNKTRIERRSPSKGSIAWGKGMYGRSSINHSDIEYAKIEIGLASSEYKGITDNMKYFIAKKNRLPRRKEEKKRAPRQEKKEKPAQLPVPEKQKAVIEQEAK